MTTFTMPAWAVRAGLARTRKPVSAAEKQRRRDERLMQMRKYRYIYALRCGDYVKFGVALNMRKRMDNYRTHNPEGVKLLGYHLGPMSIERKIHKALEADHHQGEWFKATDRALAFAAGLREGTIETLLT